MSACDTCPKPGACCHDFVLNGSAGTRGLSFPADKWMVEGIGFAERRGVPFIPLRVDDGPNSTSADGFVAIRWKCPLVTPEGRCRDYENRPQLCRDYQPGDDRLCVLYVEPVTEDKL